MKKISFHIIIDIEDLDQQVEKRNLEERENLLHPEEEISIEEEIVLRKKEKIHLLEDLIIEIKKIIKEREMLVDLDLKNSADNKEIEENRWRAHLLPKKVVLPVQV